MDDTYVERQREFAAVYEDFEAADLMKLVIATGDWMERLLFQPDAADAAMKALYRTVMGEDATNQPVQGSWRDLWTNLSGSSEFDLRMAQYFVSLNAFAFFGLRPDEDFLDRDEEADLSGPVPTGVVEAFVAKGRDLLDATPSRWADVREMERTVLAAEARLRLDLDRDVSVDQLAALARVSTKSVRNLLAPRSGEADLRLNAAGEVPAPDARRWLQKRADFRNSLWRDAPQATTIGTVDDEDEDLGEVVFVPVAKDGSIFDPVTCRTSRGYAIGRKGAEETVEDYHEALRRLGRMRRPSWRRPNATGNRGIVHGIAWERRSLAELSRGLEEDGEAL